MINNSNNNSGKPRLEALRSLGKKTASEFGSIVVTCDYRDVFSDSPGLLWMSWGYCPDIGEALKQINKAHRARGYRNGPTGARWTPIGFLKEQHAWFVRDYAYADVARALFALGCIFRAAGDCVLPPEFRR